MMERPLVALACTIPTLTDSHPAGCRGLTQSLVQVVFYEHTLLPSVHRASASRVEDANLSGSRCGAAVLLDSRPGDQASVVRNCGRRRSIICTRR